MGKSAGWRKLPKPDSVEQNGHDSMLQVSRKGDEIAIGRRGLYRT
jgi:hypothetical protein